MKKLLFVSALILLAAFPWGVSADSNYAKFFETSEKPYSVLEYIAENYVDPIDFGALTNVFVDSGLKGVFSKLLDPHSRYMTAEEADKEKAEENAAPFGGVGLKLTLEKEKIVVNEVMDGGPADASGAIAEGDIVVEVCKSAKDCRSTKGATLEEVVSWIRGPVGSEVILKFTRKDKRFSVKLNRAIIESKNVSSKVFGNVGYIRLNMFKEGSAAEIRTQILKFPKNVGGLILDLRGNPGGLLKEANTVSALFLEGGMLISKLKRRDGEDLDFAYMYKSGPTIALPLVVLVDQLSASASEIVAAAIQDNHRGMLVGMPTFGKALVQTRMNLPDGSYFALTTARLYRPVGKSLQGKGVIPDFIMTKKGGEEIEKLMEEDKKKGWSESGLKGHLAGEEEGRFSPEEKAKFELLKKDRQLQFALEILESFYGKKATQ